MKKISVLLLAFLMLLSFSACSSKSSTSNTPPDYQLGDGVAFPAHQLGDGVAFPAGAGERRDPAIHLRSYSEYLDFLSQRNLPDEFVSYDQIKELGEFEEFVLGNYDWFYGKSEEELFEVYRYEVKDENNQRLTVSVYHNGADEKLEEVAKLYVESYFKRNNIPFRDTLVVPIESDDADLRMCKTVDNGIDDSHVTVYTRQIGNLTYYYHANGELDDIEYNNGGTHIRLRLSSSLNNYPTNEKQTEMSKLLNRSTAEKEIQRFTMKIQEQDR